MLLVKCSVAQCSVWHHYIVCDRRSSGTAAAPLCPLTAIRRIYTSTVNMPIVPIYQHTTHHFTAAPSTIQITIMLYRNHNLAMDC